MPFEFRSRDHYHASDQENQRRRQLRFLLLIDDTVVDIDVIHVSSYQALLPLSPGQPRLPGPTPLPGESLYKGVVDESGGVVFLRRCGPVLHLTMFDTSGCLRGGPHHRSLQVAQRRGTPKGYGLLGGESSRQQDGN